MEFYLVNDISQLVCGYKKIKEPDKLKCDIIRMSDMDLYDKVIVIMPGLAFDGAGNRVGYGGGFYDRYIKRLESGTEHTDILKIGICYDFQYMDDGCIIAGGHDVKCDCVITDKRIIWR